MKEVLLLEEDERIRSFGADALRRLGYGVLEAASGKELYGRMENHPELAAVIMDLSVSELDAAEVCSFIRQQRPQIRVLVLAGQERQNDAVTALMNGADASLMLPFSPYQLHCAVEDLLKDSERLQVDNRHVISFGPYLLDLHSCVLEKMGNAIALTQKEYSVIRLLMENQGRTLSHQQIYEAGWKNGGRTERKAVDRLVRGIRLKIEDDPANPRYLCTDWGYGYLWNGELLKG